jgi:hypothetical protein
VVTAITDRTFEDLLRAYEAALRAKVYWVLEWQGKRLNVLNDLSSESGFDRRLDELIRRERARLAEITWDTAGPAGAR